MKRKIIRIDEEKCNGCGLCAEACHEGAIGMVGGKAKLLRDDYCDGLGDCLPVCPADAISFEEREAAAYDEKAVKANMQKKHMQKQVHDHGGGCLSQAFNGMMKKQGPHKDEAGDISSRLTHWPVQIKLAPVNAPYFQGADLLIAARLLRIRIWRFSPKIHGWKDHADRMSEARHDRLFGEADSDNQ